MSQPWQPPDVLFFCMTLLGWNGNNGSETRFKFLNSLPDGWFERGRCSGAKGAGALRLSRDFAFYAFNSF
jgi:hypothetical protein